MVDKNIWFISHKFHSELSRCLGKFLVSRNMPQIIKNYRLCLNFPNDPGDRGSIPGRVIPKTQKMILDASLLNTQQHKVGIKGKVEQSKEKSSALPYTVV